MTHGNAIPSSAIPSTALSSDPGYQRVLQPSAADAVRMIPRLVYPISDIATLRTLWRNGRIVVLPGLHLGRARHRGTAMSQSKARRVSSTNSLIEPYDTNWESGRRYMALLTFLQGL